MVLFSTKSKKKKEKTRRVLHSTNPNPNTNPNALCSALSPDNNKQKRHLPACVRACHHLLLSSSVTCSLFAVVSEIAIVAEIEGAVRGK